ncbi:MAG: leucine-rich repeat domain-containing protein, partial [Actinomycetota bacterium]|nr:leucine-rich repeat domain-containing protein [Actinomycetota bacterium]
MARLAIRSLFPVSRASSRRRVWPAQLRLTGARQPAAGALGAAVIALTVVAAVPLGVPAAPAWASTHCFTVIDNVVSDGDLCTGAVTIPKTVTSIGDFAFSGISVLTSVTFEEDSALQTIGSDAFDGSGLTSIVIPKSVTSISDYAF